MMHTLPVGDRAAPTRRGATPQQLRSAVSGTDSPGLLLNQATLTLNGSLDRALSPGLTGAQWTVVWLLHEHRSGTVSDLARAVGTDVAATWRLVERLVDKGYVARGADPHDRRAVPLNLTDAAHEAYPQWRAAVAATLAELLDGISTHDLPILNRILVRIVANGAAVGRSESPGAAQQPGALPRTTATTGDPS